MPTKAKFYVYAVMAAGAAAIAGSVIAGPGLPWNLGYAIFVLAAVLSSVVKLRLPGLTGTYSCNFLVLLFGLLHFDAASVLMAGAVSGLAQSVLNTKKRPNAMQIGFNAANVALSLGASLLAYRGLLASNIVFRPALLAFSAAVYFVINTGLVSCILSLLQGKRLSEVSGEWYSWSYPYFLIGAACLGFLPAAGTRTVGVEAWLVVLPLLYLVHFFYGLSIGRRPGAATASDDAALQPGLPVAAKAFIGVVVGLGVAVLAYAVAQWTSADPVRFAGFAALAVVAATWKVRLPGMVGTISLGFVVVLVSIIELSLAETALLCAAMGAVQSVWKTARRPALHQVVFNMSTLVVSASLAHVICGWLAASPLQTPVAIVLPLAVLVTYAANSLLVSMVICLAEQKALSTIWQQCYFWSLAYYMVGGAGAGLMIATMRAAGWVPSLTVVPLIMLVYVSYRGHVSSAKQVRVSATA